MFQSSYGMTKSEWSYCSW